MCRFIFHTYRSLSCDEFYVHIEIDLVFEIERSDEERIGNLYIMGTFLSDVRASVFARCRLSLSRVYINFISIIVVDVMDGVFMVMECVFRACVGHFSVDHA